MSLSDGGLIVDRDDDGDTFIPAPPSPRTIASIGTSAPSRDSVSAAIALVRAKQMMKSKAAATHRNGLEDLEEPMRKRVFQPRSFSSDHSPSFSSIATESSTKSKKHVSNTGLTEIENSIPGSVGSPLVGEKGIKETIKFYSTGQFPDESEKSNEQKRNSFFSMVNNVFSSRSEAQATTSSASLPKRPSFEQLSEKQSGFSTTILPVSCDIPALPSMTTTNDNDYDYGDNDYGGGDDDDDDDNEELPTVDANTLEDVNAFLNQLGVGALISPSLEQDNSY